MSSPFCQSRRGFTLIEALIAIVLVAAVLPVGLAAIGHVSQSVSRMQKQAIAARLAEARLAGWLMDGSWQTAAASGDFDPGTDGEDSAGFHWQLTTTPWRLSGVQALHLTVTWDPAAESHAVSIDTLAIPPAASSTATTSTAATP